nr:DUF4256 domain-containing protein [Arenibacter sp. ARW7G5Y1]
MKQVVITFIDCSAESPVGIRSACYDQGAQESRKKIQARTKYL